MNSAAEAQDDFSRIYRPIKNKGKGDQTYDMRLTDNKNGTLTGHDFATDATGVQMRINLEGSYFLTQKVEQGDWLITIWCKSETRFNQPVMAITAYVDAHNKNKRFASTSYATIQDNQVTRGAKTRGGLPTVVYQRD